MKTVAIVGNAKSKRFPKTGEVWIVNTAPPKGARYTRAFQLPPYAGRPPSADLWLSICDVPIYTIGTVAGSPNSRPYPLKQAQSLGGSFCSSFDYMMALAILERFRRIDLYGIALQFGTPRERLMEHVSLGYWIGMARGRGIQVKIHGEGLLTFPYLYGFDYDSERTFGQRMAMWAALGNLNFGFDDGQAKTRARGWTITVDPKKVHVEI